MSDDEHGDERQYPTEDKRSFGYQAARTTLDAAASIVPGAGYALGQVVEMVVGDPLRKRRDRFFTRIGERIEALEAKNVLDASELGENEEFVSAVYEATQIAMKTSSEEKRRLLENAVINTALGIRIDDVLRGTFYSLIERFSELHVVVLRILHDPSASPEFAHASQNVYMSSKDTVLRQVLNLPLSHADGPLERVLADLSREALTDGSERGSMMKNDIMRGSTTRSGRLFLEFISEPAL